VRAGIRTVYLPGENAADVEQIRGPSRLPEIVLVSEVVGLALVFDPGRPSRKTEADHEHRQTIVMSIFAAFAGMGFWGASPTTLLRIGEACAGRGGGRLKQRHPGGPALRKEHTALRPGRRLPESLLFVDRSWTSSRA
jgi:hypothetical protein